MKTIPDSNPNISFPFITAAIVGVMLCMLASTVTAATRKTDVIYMENGDRITGEFKRLVQGQLELSTSEMGTIYIKWKGIARIESDKYIEIELTDGTRLFGRIPPDLNSLDNVVALRTQKDATVEVGMQEIVKAEQIKVKEPFFQRLDGNVKLGLNYTQASDVLTWNLASIANYRTPRHLTSLQLDWNLTRKGEGTDTKRVNLIGTRYWFRERRWFYFGNTGGQKNEELGLDLRIFVTGGAGRFLVKTQKTEFYLGAGLSANKERETGAEDANTSLSDSGANLEGYLAADYTFFKLYSPKSRIKTSLQLYPGITESDRLRGGLDLAFSQEFITDLFWDLSFYYDYDSKPLQGAAAKEDFGVVTSLGYKF